jgi:2-polyprenyl-6-methoxyphenol hydroxylase-like FAD-dependent oxidoreductase
MPRALIAGGSLGGLFAANLLQRQGWDVEVFERAPVRLDGRGAGIVTHPPLVEALARAGCPAEGSDLGVAVAGRIAFAPDGAVLGRHALPQVLTSWSRLYSLLDQACSETAVHRGWALESFEQDQNGITASFANGQQAQGDLLVGADGIRSAVRRKLHPDVTAQYAGYIAWRGLADETALSPATHAALFDRFAFSLPDGEQMLGYPIAGDADDTRAGRRRYNFVWYRPADAARLRDMQTDETGRHHPDGIPPGLIRQDLVTAMRADADRLLGPQFADVVRQTTAPFFQSIWDLAVPSMIQDRVALLGDAAFVARPHVGMGVTKAAQDAMALADALAAHASIKVNVPAALRSYDALRQPASAAVVQRARALGGYMEAQARPTISRATDPHRTPAAVMTETAWMEGISRA